MSDLIADLKRDEGVRLLPYVDTVGKVTIGVGRNLTDNGISQEEMEVMLENDVEAVLNECLNLTCWASLNPTQRRGLANMVFNMGLPRVRGFKKMLAALEAGEYLTAYAEALDSKWARQVGDRAQRVATLLRG